VVLEILETVEVNADLLARCAALRRQGFRLALDDFSGQEERFEPLLPVVDVIKVDLHRVAPGALEQTTSRLRRWPAWLLAEKIDSEEQVQRCRDLGYDLFQGYHLGRPRLISFGPPAVAPDTPGWELLDVRRVPR
jgi:EAL and modified HD-GYP domain-containing signal transduction protein